MAYNATTLDSLQQLKPRSVTPLSAMPPSVMGSAPVNWTEVAKDPASPYFHYAVMYNMEGLTPQSVSTYFTNTANNSAKEYQQVTTPIRMPDGSIQNVAGMVNAFGTTAAGKLDSAASYLLSNGYTAEQLLPSYQYLDNSIQYSSQANASGMASLDEQINGEKDWSKRVGGVLEVAMPAVFAATAGLATGGAASAAGVSTIGAGAAGGAAAGVASSATSGHGTVWDVAKAGGIGALTGAVGGGVASAASPALSSGIQGATGASQGVANTAAGALTAGGANAATQYVTTGSVNPIGVATSGLMGGIKGYNSAPSVSTDPYSLNQPGYLNGGLDANGLYNSAGSASLLGGDSGLMVDASLAPSFNSSYTAPSYYPTTNPGLSLTGGNSGLMVDPDFAPDFKPTYDTGIQPTTQVGVDPKTKIPYDKLIKAGLAAFGGATAAGTSGTAASSYAPKTFTPWDKLADFKVLGSAPAAEAAQEDNTFGLNSSFGANWYNYA